MSPETFSAVLGGLTDGVVGALLGFLGAFLLFRLSKKRRVIEYSVSSISLLRLKPTTDSVFTLSVSKAVLTGNMLDQDDMLSLNTAYGFQITLTNTGNEDIEKIDDIEISLDKSAKIVRCETEPPSTSGYTIGVRKNPESLNVVHISVPYMNAKATMVIRLISTENADSSCVVIVHGVGIRTTQARLSGLNLRAGGIIGLLLVAMGLGFAILDSNTHHPPASYNTPLEWASIIFLLGGMVIYGITSVFNDIQAAKRQKLSQDWDWNLPKSSKKQNFLQRWFS